MDFELIENLSNEQVDELYSDMVDGDDKLSGWKCTVSFSSTCLTYVSPSGQHYTDVSFNPDSYFIGIRNHMHTKYTNYDTGNSVYSGNWSAARRVEVYTKKTNLINGNVSYAKYVGTFDSDQFDQACHSGEARNVYCDDAYLCVKYFDYMLFRFRHCNINGAFPYSEVSGIDELDDGTFRSYQVYTECNSVGSNADMFIHVINSKYMHLNFSHHGAYSGSLLYNKYFEFLYSNNGIHEVETLTKIEHFHGILVDTHWGVGCLNNR